ncbi:MAG: ABC transporter permease [Spirochaetes bacterium]|nr:MAG: ABC transporter permease [Spirochaetota bacterium]
MSLKLTGVLLGKELFTGPKNFIFVWVILAPVAISFVISLIFGTLFTEQPRLGIVDEGGSQLTVIVSKSVAVNMREYSSVDGLKRAVKSGSVDMGVVLPEGFDDSVKKGEKTSISALIWGESSSRNRTILSVTIINLVREIAGQEPPVEVRSITLGDEVTIPWNERLLPLIVIMAVFLGGIFLPATSIIGEKEKGTLTALLVTPATPEDVFLAKGIVGIVLSLISGVVILLLNRAFGTRPLLLLMVLALGAVMAAELGLLMGVVLKDITTLFAVWKLGGILLFGPAFIYMFPGIPQWVGKLFPTYYIVQPIVEISQYGAGWETIATSVYILIAIDLLMIGLVAMFLKRARRLEFA